MTRALAGFAAALGLLALLAACGADGEPEKPEPRGGTGVTVSGEARIGVVWTED